MLFSLGLRHACRTTAAIKVQRVAARTREGSAVEAVLRGTGWVMERSRAPPEVFVFNLAQHKVPEMGDLFFSKRQSVGLLL